MMTSSSSHRPHRRSSGFTPAARVHQNTGEKQYMLATNVEKGYAGHNVAADDDPRERETVVPEAEHRTKLGQPDRRFKGQREIPEEEVIVNPDYQPARTGGTLDDGTHITMIGRPDKRFKENRGLSDEEVNRKWAEELAKEYGLIEGE